MKMAGDKHPSTVRCNYGSSLFKQADAVYLTCGCWKQLAANTKVIFRSWKLFFPGLWDLHIEQQFRHFAAFIWMRYTHKSFLNVELRVAPRERFSTCVEIYFLFTTASKKWIKGAFWACLALCLHPPVGLGDWGTFQCPFWHHKRSVSRTPSESYSKRSDRKEGGMEFSRSSDATDGGHMVLLKKSFVNWMRDLERSRRFLMLQAQNCRPSSNRSAAEKQGNPSNNSINVH